MVGGVTLCLLGLLALGSKRVWFNHWRSEDIHYGNALYGLVAKSMGIAIVFLVYLAVQLGYMVSGQTVCADASLPWRSDGACFMSSANSGGRARDRCIGCMTRHTWPLPVPFHRTRSSRMELLQHWIPIPEAGSPAAFCEPSCWRRKPEPPRLPEKAARSLAGVSMKSA